MILLELHILTALINVELLALGGSPMKYASLNNAPLHAFSKVISSWRLRLPLNTGWYTGVTTIVQHKWRGARRSMIGFVNGKLSTC